ncbi:MAG: DUF4271 domain-containing protein [Bacteroidota bacterium]
MIEKVFHPRIIENKDWATLIFILVFVLITVIKSSFENRFTEFLRLIVSDKYIKIYRDSSNLLSWFNIILFIVQLVSFAFFIQLTLHYQYPKSVEKTDIIVFVQIFTFLGVFILSKYLIEKIIATSFDIEEFTEQFNLHKVSYRTYIGLCLLPINIILYYNDNLPIMVIFILIAIILTTIALSYMLSLKNYQNALFGKLFYFILYLCALEIAPYYFMYYWFVKS